MTRIFLPALLLVFSAAGIAQDANYWSSTYGPGGFFSPGSTIAKNGDSGVLFYNPALLAYNTKTTPYRKYKPKKAGLYLIATEHTPTNTPLPTIWAIAGSAITKTPIPKPPP